MTQSSLLFAIKCAVILYFAAFSSIDHLTIARSASPLITKGAWRVDLYSAADKDKTNDLAGYNFVFGSTGELKASKNGVEITGNWSEDNISKRITFDLGKADPMLAKLNDYWNIEEIANVQVNLQGSGCNTCDRIKITAL